MLSGQLDEAFYVFVTLIAMLNPISGGRRLRDAHRGPLAASEQAQIARRASIVAAITLIAFAFAGEALLDALGVEIGAFKIAGGLLLLKVGFDMVFAENDRSADAPTARRRRRCPRAIRRSFHWRFRSLPDRAR